MQAQTPAGDESEPLPLLTQRSCASEEPRLPESPAKEQSQPESSCHIGVSICSSWKVSLQHFSTRTGIPRRGSTHLSAAMHVVVRIGDAGSCMHPMAVSCAKHQGRISSQPTRRSVKAPHESHDNVVHPERLCCCVQHMAASGSI